MIGLDMIWPVNSNMVQNKSRSVSEGGHAFSFRAEGLMRGLQDEADGNFMDAAREWRGGLFHPLGMSEEDHARPKAFLPRVPPLNKVGLSALPARQAPNVRCSMFQLQRFSDSLCWNGMRASFPVHPACR